jgi:hypothetical protein
MSGIIFIYLWGWCGVQPFIGLLYQPWMIDGDDSGAISGMNE